MIRNRLAKLLAAEKDRVGSCNQLEKQILRTTNVKVDRRKISDIIETEKNVLLSIEQLTAIHEYIAQYNYYGLREVFDRPNVIQSIARANDVIFLLGSQPREADRRTDLSRWDILAMHETVAQINNLKSNVRIDLQDVIQTIPTRNVSKWKRSLRDEQWYREVVEEERSIISVGTTRACLATELVMSEMFGENPFVPPNDHTCALPFRFYWTPSCTSMPSAFAGTPEQLARIDKHLSKSVRNNKAWAFQVGGQAYRLSLDVRKSTTYGIVAAQRRRSGQIWLVIAGLSGPGTFAASKLVGDLTVEIPRSTVGEHSAVVWLPIRVEVECSRIPGDNRKVVGIERMCDPRIYRRAET